MLEVNNISYTIGSKKLLHDISFEGKRGELIGVLGANGAGKSTLLKLLCKELNLQCGNIQLNGTKLCSYGIKELAKVRSVLSQQNYLSISFDVEDLVMMGRYPHFDQDPTEHDRSIIAKTMEMTGTSCFCGRDFNTLSGGEQQRVQLARVLAQIYDQQNAVLFMDEPLNGMDILYQQQTLSLARKFADEGHLVICILHDINFASQYADKILMLRNGELKAWGEPQEVITKESIYEVFGIAVDLIKDDKYKYPLVVTQAMFQG